MNANKVSNLKIANSMRVIDRNKKECIIALLYNLLEHLSRATRENMTPFKSFIEAE